MLHRTFVIPGYMLNYEQASMRLHCQIHSSSSQTGLTGFNYDSTQPLVTFTWQFHHETFMAHSWDKESTKNRLRKSFFETKLISCADNSKVAFNVETDVLLISALFSTSKLLLTEQLIGWAGSSSILIVSVRILKLEENVIWTIAQRKLTYKP